MAVILDATHDAPDERRPSPWRWVEMKADPVPPELSPTPADEEKVNDGPDPLRWLDGDDSLNRRLRFDDYHSYVAPDRAVPALPLDGRSHRPSFRRAALYEYASRISGRPWAMPISTAGRAAKEHGGRQPPRRPCHHRKRSSLGLPTAFFRSPHHPTSIPEPQGSTGSSSGTATAAAATYYYRDPEARLKLRTYLASPQKFDEAIEFGFPSADQQVGSSARPPPPSSLDEQRKTFSSAWRRRSRWTSMTKIHALVDDPDRDGGRIFEDDDTEEDESEKIGDDDHTDDDDDDETSSPDTEVQPPTPVDLDLTTFRSPHRLPTTDPTTKLLFPPLHSSDLLTTARNRAFECSYTTGATGGGALTAAANREMTLRLTLTRPDLQFDSPVVDDHGDDHVKMIHRRHRPRDHSLSHLKRSTTTTLATSTNWVSGHPLDPLTLSDDLLRLDDLLVSPSSPSPPVVGGGDFGRSKSMMKNEDGVGKGKRMTKLKIGIGTQEGTHPDEPDRWTGQIQMGPMGMGHGMKRLWKKMITVAGTATTTTTTTGDGGPCGS